MSEAPAAPDVDLLAIKIRDDVLADITDLTVTDRFPLDGANLPTGGARVLVVARVIPGGGDIDTRFLYVVNYAVDVWAPQRAQAFEVSDRVRRWLVARGGRRIDDNGVLASGRCTLRPTREPSGDPNARLARYVATYDLTIRAAAVPT